MVAPGTTDDPIFYLPDLGEGLDEAELIEWTVRVGQEVAENDPLARMETAKALVDVPSPRAGVIAMLHGKPGQSIKVGAPLVTFRDQGSPPQGRNGGAKAAQAPQPTAGFEGEGRHDAGSVVGDLSEAESEAEHGDKVQAAPAVRRLAREMGVELSHLTGTGIGGRITAHDVKGAVAESPNLKSQISNLKGAGRPPQPSSGVPEEGERAAKTSALGAGPLRIPFRGVRRTIAEHLRFSVSHAVHFTVMDEADVSALDALRRKLVAASNEKISLLPFVAVAVCRVLAGRAGAKFARLNSTVDDDKQEIVQHRLVHLGIATDTDAGLMVPVIRDADRLGVLALSREIAALANAARHRDLRPEQLTGSTFTLSNFGAMGGRFGTPIINYPEAGILAIGRAREGVVVRDGMLGVGKLLPLSLSADHRVIDGGTAATALAKIVDLLQSPDELLPPGEEAHR
jgi:pyruvate dehydrogenase E2 component (dihydrolipoamide acetyltransferase)